MNRATYWLCLGILVAIVAVIAVFGIRPPRIGEAMLILMCVPRLHDIGKSGWWVAIPIVFELIAGIVVVTVFSAEDAGIAFGVIFLAVIGFIAVLGLIPGEPQANRFGEPPKSPFTLKERQKIARTEEIFK